MKQRLDLLDRHPILCITVAVLFFTVMAAWTFCGPEIAQLFGGGFR